MVTRREFLATIGASYVASVSHVTSAAASMRYGYAAITWGSAVTQAIDDIAAVGFRGIQLRGEAVAQFGDRPAVLRELLESRRLTFAVLSSGNLSIDPARERDELATHTRHAQFVRDAGGTYLQVIDERPKGRMVVADDYRRLGRLMTELDRVPDAGRTPKESAEMNKRYLIEQAHQTI